MRPKHVRFKTFEEAAIAVDDLYSAAFQNAGRKSFMPSLCCLSTHLCDVVVAGDDSGEDSGDEQERRDKEDDEDGDRNGPDSPVSLPIHHLRLFIDLSRPC